MPVDFSYVQSGVANVTNPIGQTKVDLPVRGAPGHPAFTTIKWRTPADPGHYCIRVNLIWSNDANPANNTGQENCQVSHFNSPTAKFRFRIKNDHPVKRTFNLVADAYEIPALPLCPPETKPTKKLTPSQKDTRRAPFLRLHDQSNYPVPEGWQVDILPKEFALDVNGEQMVDVTVSHSFPDFIGEKTFNVNAYVNGKLAGGVTLIAKT